MSATEHPDRPVYVYGVVDADARVAPPNDGVGGQAVELVSHDGLAALVSDVPDGDVRISRRDLLAHLRTLEQVFEQTTIAPCSFGMVLVSRRAVEDDFLAPRADELRRLLDRLAGHVQMNVKVEYDEEAALREIVAEDRDVAALRARTQQLGDAAYYENIRLGELVAARLGARRADDAQRIEARLRPIAPDALVEADRNELTVFKASFLVERGVLPAFDAALDELAAADRERLRFEAIGPLPPTAFATLQPEG